MKKILLTTLILVGLVHIYDAKAQQEAQVSHNMFNNMAINPAAAGSNDAICATAISRKQWMGFDGSPTTTLISVDAPFSLFSFQHGVGLTIVSDALGFEKNTGAKLSYAFRKPLGTGMLSVGVNGGFYNNTLDFSKFTPTDAGFINTTKTDDPLLQGTAVEKSMLFDLGFGLYYKIPSKLHVGLSSNLLMQPKGSFGDTKAGPNLKRHYYFSGGYIYQLSPEWEILPSVFIKTDGNATQVDINALAMYRERFWGGVSYRPADAVVAMVGLFPFSSGMMKTLRVGFAYDLTTSALKAKSSGTVEVMLSYCFKLEVQRIPSSYRTVRYL